MEEEEKGTPEGLSSVEEEGPAQRGKPGERSSKGSFTAYIAAAFWCFLFGAMAIAFGNSGGFISLGEEKVGYFLFSVGALFTVAGLVRALRPGG